jgi:hypothetical protein
MNISTINFVAVLVAAVSNFLIGGLWYSPILFGKQWMQENKFLDEDLKKGKNALIFISTFLFSFIMATNLAMFLNDPKTTISWGAIAGFLVGFGWVALAFCIISVFERKSVRYMLIHSGYVTISFMVMGIILAAFR